MPTFTLKKIATFCIFKKSRLLLKIADFYPKNPDFYQKVSGRREHTGIRAYFFFFLVLCVFFLVEKEGEGFVVFLNHCGGNLTTIIITIKDF
jgi:hypothetical protein